MDELPGVEFDDRDIKDMITPKMVAQDSNPAEGSNHWADEMDHLVVQIQQERVDFKRKAWRKEQELQHLQKEKEDVELKLSISMKKVSELETKHRDEMNKKINKWKTEMDLLKGTIKSQLDDLKKEQDKSAKIQKEENDIESQLEQTKEEMDKLTASKQLLQEKFNVEVAGLKAAVDRLEKENLLQVDRIQVLEAALVEEQAKTNEQSEMTKKLESRINTLQQNLAAKKNNFTAVKTELTQSKEQVVKLKDNLKKEQQKSESLEKEKLVVRAELQLAKERSDESTASMMTLLNQKDVKISLLNSEVDSLQEANSLQVNEIDSLKAALENEQESMRKKNQKNEELESTVAKLQQDLDGEREQFAIAVSEMILLNEKVTELDGNLKTEQRKSDNLQTEKVDLEAKLQLSTEKVNELTASAEKLQVKINAEIVELKHSVDSLNEANLLQANEIQSLRNDLKAGQERMEQEIAKSEESESRANRLQIDLDEEKKKLADKETGLAESRMKIIKLEATEKTLGEEKTIEETKWSTQKEGLEDTVQLQFSEITRIQNDLKRERREAESMKKEKTDVETKLTQAEEQVKALRDEKSLKEAKWSKQKEDLEGTVKLQSSEISRLQETVKIEQSEFERIQNEKSDVELKLKLSEDKIDTLKGTVSALRNEKKADGEKWKREVDRLNDEIRVQLGMINSLETAPETTRESTEQMSELQSRISALQRELDAEKKSTARENKSITKNEELRRRITQMEGNHDIDIKELRNRHQDAIKRKDEEIKKLSEKLESQKTEINPVDVQGEQRNLQLISRINELINVNKGLQQQLKAFEAMDKKSKETDKDHNVMVRVENEEKYTGSSSSNFDGDLTVKNNIFTGEPVSDPPKKRGRPPKKRNNDPQAKKSKYLPYQLDEMDGQRIYEPFMYQVNDDPTPNVASVPDQSDVMAERKIYYPFIRVEEGYPLAFNATVKAEPIENSYGDNDGAFHHPQNPQPTTEELQNCGHDANGWVYVQQDSRGPIDAPHEVRATEAPRYLGHGTHDPQWTGNQEITLRQVALELDAISQRLGPTAEEFGIMDLRRRLEAAMSQSESQ